MSDSIAIYPLEAVRRRERWLLEGLQSRLATATSEQASRRDRHAGMLGDMRDAVAATTPATGASIEPQMHRLRLQYLSDRQCAISTAARELAAIDEASARLRQAVIGQHVRVESVERHRAGFLRDTATREERKRDAEADRDWLARALWQREPEVSACADGAKGHLLCDRGRR